MVDRKASIHDHRNTGGFEAPCHVVMPYSLLHPDQLRVDFEELIQQRRDVLRAAENVHDIDRSPCGCRTEVRVHGLT
jgi:hypothetical protein